MNTDQRLKVLVTGVTGMVGEGVLHECLLHPQIESVVIITRKSSGVKHPKLKEIIHQNFLDLSSVEPQLSGLDACFFCLGVSSVGMKKDDYYRMTYLLTLHVGQTLAKLNPEMTFCYVSGAGTDSTEKGKSHWARVKGKTENELFALFKNAYAFRPGYIHPTKGLQYAHQFYNYIGWLYPILVKFFPNSANTLQEVGLAMIEIALHGYGAKIIDPKDIRLLAARWR